jgi:hypothetical protein
LLVFLLLNTPRALQKHLPTQKYDYLLCSLHQTQFTSNVGFLHRRRRFDAKRCVLPSLIKQRVLISLRKFPSQMILGKLFAFSTALHLAPAFFFPLEASALKIISRKCFVNL